MKKQMKKFKNEDGFTLIEMSIVLIIVALLLLLMVPNISSVMSNATGKTDKVLIENVEAQMELYKVDKNRNDPPSLEELKSEGYISEEQLTAYQNAKSKTPIEPGQ